MTNATTEPIITGHEHDAEFWNKHRRKGRPPRLKIYGQTMATHAAGVLQSDLTRIRQVIEQGVTAGLSNTEIAHAVIGSRKLKGMNGQTEQTRQNVLRLARGYLRARKNRMAGSKA